MARSKALIEAQKRYNREKTKSVIIKLNKTTDADILAKLDAVGNKQGYIKDLIRKDINGR